MIPFRSSLQLQQKWFSEVELEDHQIPTNRWDREPNDEIMFDTVQRQAITFRSIQIKEPEELENSRTQSNQIKSNNHGYFYWPPKFLLNVISYGVNSQT